MVLKSFSVTGYKNFTAPVHLDDLGPVNVIHGDNNVGKSNLLEATHLLFRLLSRQVIGDSLPFGRAQSLGDQAFREHTGHRVGDIFHARSRAPITLGARLCVTHGELEAAGIQPLLPTDDVELELRLELVAGELQVSITRFRFGPDADAAAATGARLAFIQRFALYLARNKLIHDGEERPSFALIEEDRRVRGEAETERDESSRIPRHLSLQLYKAKDSLESDRVGRWELFAETVESFAPLRDTGRLRVRYDVDAGHAELMWDTGRYRVPARLLGSGVQQVIAVVGQLLMTDAALVAVEEPESNLRYSLQVELRDVLRRLVDDERGPTQLFLTSHSPAFESGDHFYGLRLAGGQPVVEKRPIAEAPEYTGLDGALPPPQGSARRSFVSSEGLVEVPPFVLRALGIEQGGNVFFKTRKETGRVEMLNHAQLMELFGADADEDGD